MAAICQLFCKNHKIIRYSDSKSRKHGKPIFVHDDDHGICTHGYGQTKWS